MMTTDLNDNQRRVRSAVRAFLMLATRAELEKESAISLARRDTFRAACVDELIAELGDFDSGADKPAFPTLVRR